VKYDIEGDLIFSDKFDCTLTFSQILSQIYEKFKSHYADCNEALSYVSVTGKNQYNNFIEIYRQAWSDSAVMYDQLEIHFQRKPSKKIVQLINSL